MGYTANPAAVVYAYDTSDVVAAVDCARAAGVRVSVAGRRHSYMGLSIVDGALAIGARAQGAQGARAAAMRGKRAACQRSAHASRLPVTAHPARCACTPQT